VLLAIQRLGETKELTVTLVPEKDFFNADLVQRRIGLTLQEITPQLAQTLGLGNTTGLIVAGVEAIGPAAASLKPGAVITAVDGQLPANLTTFAKMLHAKVKGDTARLGVVLQQRQGNFVLYRQGVVEIPVQ
jgi:S1-C subfamily serine protease